MSSDLLENINARMHAGTCPTAGSLGECPALLQVIQKHTPNGPRVLVTAVLSIWDQAFHDCEAVAAWFKEEGACEVYMTHVLHDPDNEIHAGFEIDSTRSWIVDAWFPVDHPGVADIVEVPRDGVDHIQIERNRQRSVEGRDAKHDSQYIAGELALAAACYALPITHHWRTDALIWNTPPDGWPWDKAWWKPSPVFDDGHGNAVIDPPARIVELRKAGALIAAEIDRLLTFADKAKAGAA